MRGYLLVSHGSYAKALKESLAMITGEMDSVFAIGLEHSDGPESFTKKIEDELAKMSAFESIVVFTDLLGGSPGNATVAKFLKDDHVSVVSGMNFPMLLSTVLTENVGIDEIAQFGKDGIVDVKKFISENSFDDDE